jgi:hypothetical protein
MTRFRPMSCVKRLSGRSWCIGEPVFAGLIQNRTCHQGAGGQKDGIRRSSASSGKSSAMWNIM